MFAHSAVEKQRITVSKLLEYSDTFNEEDPLSDSEAENDEILLQAQFKQTVDAAVASAMDKENTEIDLERAKSKKVKTKK